MANKKEEVNRYYFLTFLEPEDLEGNPLGDETFRALKPYTKRLYYLDDNYAWVDLFAYSYAEELFIDEPSHFGVRIANMLKTELSSKSSDEIEFIDVVNPFQIPNIDILSDKFVSHASTTVVLEDERFVCGITPKDERIMRVYLFKK